ncbi:MAG: hypothetical protein GXO96_06545, partial [Nitrospirae bacterium]|nr:hypothetical protein [Candidatus Manganitrophaceae bacterium]
LPTTPLEHPAMDYAFLRQEGIRLIEKMAGKVWTDFNAHDPGITILEQLCYAITDLAYRINYDLPDLMAGKGRDPYQSLYGPAEILSSEPLTLIDFRKLIVDVPGVKNAWIELLEKPPPLYFHEGKNTLSLQSEAQAFGPQVTEPIYLKGLYRILIETSSLVDIEGPTVAREVALKLNAHRGLCEDFDMISILEHQSVSVLAQIEIGAVDDAGEVLAQIYFKISNYFSPALPFKTLGEMLDAETPVDEIFEGPLLQQGFLDTESLKKATKRTVLYTSDLIHEIMQVEGVRAVTKIRLQSGGKIEDWSLNIDDLQVPQLLLTNDAILLEKEGISASIDPDWVKTRYLDLLKAAVFQGDFSSNAEALDPPKGRDRQIAQYGAIQRHFPDLYGIGEMGIADSASEERKGQSKQLKAYLLFFDQLLANYFSQLSEASSLFSFYGKSNETYFSQMIDDSALGLDAVIQKSPEDFEAQLQKLSEKSTDDSLQRKNRFLNHLMARFSEQFTDYSLILFDLVEEGRDAALEKLVQDKQAYLQNYPAFSAGRNRAFDVLNVLSSENRSGLEMRIRLKLSLNADEAEDFFLIEHILLRPMSGDDTQQVPLLAALQSKDPYSLQLSFVFPKGPKRFEQTVFLQFIHQTLRAETPAHLIPHVHWLDPDTWSVFKTSYGDWFEKRRLYLRNKLGV